MGYVARTLRALLALALISAAVADSTPPNFSPGYPAVTSVDGSGFDLEVKSSEAGKVFYYGIASGFKSRRRSCLCATAWCQAWCHLWGGLRPSRHASSWTARLECFLYPPHAAHESQGVVLLGCRCSYIELKSSHTHPT